jgi:type II secretory ATPase GspE/PulE/Tfp pilus assembly ATPase PilB-like protein
MRHRLPVDAVSERIEEFLREGHPGGAFLWLMRYALRSQASDVHIEPRENWALVRMRVHGIMEQVAILSELAVTSLINGIKNRSEQPAVANANVGKDADGAFVDPDLGIHVRVSLLPTISKRHDVALRLLPLEDVVSRHDLGYTEEEWDRIMSVVLSAQNGIILLTGPQGSGKSTTMSGMIERTDVRGRKILEIADPVEYRTWSHTQAEVWGEGEKGWSYADASRSSLRHDTNMMKIQEIRDADTARIAIHAARTGQLVVSTLHVTGAFGVGDRFGDLGITQKEIFSVLRLVVNQRLVRTLCPDCRRKTPLDMEDVRGSVEIRKVVEGLNVTEVYEPVGCRECSSGYVGRHPIAEIAVLDAETGDRLQADSRASEYALARLYRECHPEYESLEQRGVRDVLEGRTSLAEILRTVGGYR